VPATDNEESAAEELVRPVISQDMERFVDIRQPLHLDDHTPHGYISVRHIEFINDNFYGRSPFTYQEKETAIWIVEELLAMGYTWDDIEVQEFTWEEARAGWAWMSWRALLRQLMNDGVLGDAQPRSTTLSQNVILTVPGQSDRTIIVGAHYDSVKYPGASDNASGTALLLESAQRMLHLDNYYTIVYMFFGAHETGGFHGTRFYLNSLAWWERQNILFMTNADVLFERPYMVPVFTITGSPAKTILPEKLTT